MNITFLGAQSNYSLWINFALEKGEKEPCCSHITNNSFLFPILCQHNKLNWIIEIECRHSLGRNSALDVIKTAYFPLLMTLTHKYFLIQLF